MDSDIKYLYAAHKHITQSGVSPKDFKTEYGCLIHDKYDYGWTIEAPTSKGVIPVGCVFGIQNGDFIMVGDLIWFPWASNRNKLEGIIEYINGVRKEHLVLFYSQEKDKRFYVHIMRYGIINRIGRIDEIYDEPATLFQTRK